MAFTLTHLKDHEIMEILNEALKTGGEYAEVFMENTSSSHLEMTRDKVTNAATTMLHGAALRIIKGVTAVNGTTTDTSYQSLLGLAKKLADSFDGNQSVFVKKLIDNTNDEIVKLKHDRLNDSGVELLSRANAAALAYSPEIVQVVSRIIKKNQEVFIFSSDEVKAHDHRHNSIMYVTVVASDGKEIQNINSSHGANQGMDFFDDFDPESFAIDAATSAITMLHADEMIGGEIPVVIHNGFGGVILHEACGHSLEATSVARNMSVFCGKIGQKIASDIVTAVDTGIDPNAWGSLNVDDEGTKVQKNILIENGILKTYLVDKRNGKKMNHPITASSRRQSYKIMPTSRMTNTYFVNGKDEFEDIIKDTQYGLFAKRMGGGSVNPVTGEFNFAVDEGYLIENGKITKPVRGATIVGSGKDILMNVDRISNNLSLACGSCGSLSGTVYTSVGQPTIRISKMTVGGKGGIE